MLTDIDLEAEVNLNLEPPCEALFHQEINATDSAYYIVRAHCNRCGKTALRQVGKQCYATAMESMLECGVCKDIEEGWAVWKVVQVL